MDELKAVLGRLGFSSLEERDDTGWTPLMWAVLESPDDVKILIDHGADIEAREEGTQCTALFIAAECLQTDSMKVLLDHGASINATNKAGDTPLSCLQAMYRVYQGSPAGDETAEIIDLMLSHPMKPEQLREPLPRKIPNPTRFMRKPPGP